MHRIGAQGGVQRLRCRLGGQGGALREHARRRFRGGADLRHDCRFVAPPASDRRQRLDRLLPPRARALPMSALLGWQWQWKL